MIYFFYPVTGNSSLGFSLSLYVTDSLSLANRTLEDMDAYYRTNPPLIVAGDADAISTKRPLQFVYHEDEEVQKNAKNAVSGTAEYAEHVN